jgi:hypothetical protein
MPNPGNEISSLDFRNIIGGPLIAVVEAQAQAALSTVNYIKSVGFDADGKVVNVSFRYPKEVSPYRPGNEGQAPTPAVYQQMELQVPILTMLPIPYIRIEEMSLDFNVKINSMETYNVSDQLDIGGALEFQQGWGSGSVKLNVSASYKRTTSAGTSVERTYDMAVHVRAVQDEPPGGLETILGILEQAVVSTPVTE